MDPVATPVAGDRPILEYSGRLNETTAPASLDTGGEITGLLILAALGAGAVTAALLLAGIARRSS